MLLTKILKNNYQDSINLMLLTNKVNEFEKVNKSQIMMGTNANKDILQNTGLLTDEAKTASPNDIIIVVDSDEDITEEILKEVDSFLSDLSVSNKGGDKRVSSTWEEAFEALPEANLALFSIPGEYGADEMERALNKGLHVFSFTDNVDIEDEVKLKKLAKEKGLLMMGPDCGTGIISGIPLAFANVVSTGNIGIVAASGTGIQEVTTIIDRLGGGVSHAIGTGGRDLSKEVGAITTKDAIVALENHEFTDVICIISKPPAKEVRDDVVELLHSISKPVVAIFLGEKPVNHEGNVYFAHTLEEAAYISVDLAEGRPVKKLYTTEMYNKEVPKLGKGKLVKGLYSGGTLASEAAMLIEEALGKKTEDVEGYVLKAEGYEIFDLGDDMYTRGKPHPMIDPEVRKNHIHEAAKEENTGVIILDIVLGYGSHEDMIAELLPVIKEEKEAAKKDNRDLYFIATVVGTDRDPQNYSQTVKRLRDAGVFVESSNANVVKLALKMNGIEIDETEKETLDYVGEKIEFDQPTKELMDLLTLGPKVINVGIKSFNETIKKYGGESEHLNWKPRAGGNKKMIKILNALEKYSDEIDEENRQVLEKIKNAKPFLVDVVAAKTVIPVLNDESQKTLLHAGPPIKWEEMTGPMKGSCIGAVLFEGWAKTEEEALELLGGGKIRFIPCHHVNAVGPMGGITSANMGVLVVENQDVRGYCIMNEGIGKVLRFGAYSEEVIDRLIWMRDVLGPTIARAIKQTENGLNLNVMVARAITMGDEFHQRNIAASLIFLKEVAPLIVQLDMDEKDKYDVIKFLADTDQFFLNIMMAIGKSIVDDARKDAKGTIVTTLTRNGVNFGVRIAETGDQWFTAPVNRPSGLYFTGYSEDDGNPDIGDSAVTETIGVGGMAMVAAPGVTRFVGAGGFQDALEISNEMAQICVEHNPNWSIPTWDFKGAVLGIDIRKVVETGITPIINTGIAHKVAGIGQVGAGTVRAPLGCFEKALEAYAATKGIKVD